MEQESQNSSKGEQNQSSKEERIIKTKFPTESSKVLFQCFVLCVCAGDGGLTSRTSLDDLTFCFYPENVRSTYLI